MRRCPASACGSRGPIITAVSRRGSAGNVSSGRGWKTRPTSKIATRSVKRRLARAVFSWLRQQRPAQVRAIGRERVQHL